MNKQQQSQFLAGVFDEALSLSNDGVLAESLLLNELQNCSDRYGKMTIYKTGGSKIIYEAHDKITDRLVAVATLKEQPSVAQIDSFIREARLNALLQHPNIVPVYDIGVDNQLPFFSMKFIAGNSLADIIDGLRSSEPHFLKNFPITVLLDLFLKLCNSMSYAHTQGVAHLDLKPENIRVDKFGDVLICDWGLAAVLDNHEAINDHFGSLENYSINQLDLQNHTIDGFVKGTPGYMAPEQTSRTKFSKGVWTDTYSLGSILYSILCYEVPYKGELEEILKNTAVSRFESPAKLRAGVPAQLEAICLKAMKLDPQERYQTAEELHDDILAYRNGYITSAEDVTALKLLSFFVRRNKALTVIVLVFLSLLVTFTIFFIKSLNESRGSALELAEKYRLERNENLKRGSQLATQFLKKYKAADIRYDFDDAMAYVNSAIRLDPTLKDAYFYKGKLHCISFQFKEAVAAYKLSGRSDLLSQIAFKYQDISGPISVKLKLEVIAAVMQEYGNNRPSSEFVHRQVYSEMSLTERLEFVKGILKLFNKSLTELKFSYDKESSLLDISENSQLNWAYAVQSFPLKGLNISHTGIGTLSNFRATKLQVLIASHTALNGFADLNVENLRSLDISHTRIADLKSLEKSPIQSLNIAHSRVKSLRSLAKVKYLRNLVVHKGQFSETDLSNLAKNVAVEIID